MSENFTCPRCEKILTRSQNGLPHSTLCNNCYYTAHTIELLRTEIQRLRDVADAAKTYFTEDLDSGIDMSKKWFKSYNRVKEALAELEKK